jgi:dolichol-phosphate mannosyltransferase
MKNIIIIPTYNERKNIAVLVPMIFDLLPDVDIVVADDNSPDGTADVVLEMAKKYPNLSLLSRKEKDGLGRAYINAFKKVLERSDVRSVIMMDADLSLQPKYLPEMIKASEHYSVVTGSRYIKGSQIIGWKFRRRMLSKFANLYCKMIIRLPLNDYTCGFNVIDAKLIRTLDFSKFQNSGYAFILELKYRLYKAGATFHEIPIVFVERVEGESKISNKIIKEGIKAPWKLLFTR